MGADIGGIDIAHCVSRNTGRRSPRPDSTEVARIRYEREQRPIDGTADHDAAQFSRLHSRRRVASGRLVPERDTDINLVIRSDENRAWLAKLIPGGDEIAVLVENLDTAVEGIGSEAKGKKKSRICHNPPRRLADRRYPCRSRRRPSCPASSAPCRSGRA